MILRTPLIGRFNIENCLAAAAAALAVGIAPEAIERGIAATHGAPGRCEPVLAGQPFPVIVDYAHTPDSLEKILANLRPLAAGKLIVVFGAGGDRDPGKRPLMGRAAAQWADEIIVTSDNPRTEDPESIAAMVIEGVQAGLKKGHNWRKELDRRAAIAAAVALADEGDVVVLAGKGHEDYQIVGTEKRHFDDREEARAALAERIGRSR
jgi:UDP-N-acetylmuramoyl-L-alanyl-D-glutamate--2,6-diaminopimelate ligase